MFYKIYKQTNKQTNKTSPRFQNDRKIKVKFSQLSCSIKYISDKTEIHPNHAYFNFSVIFPIFHRN